MRGHLALTRTWERPVLPETSPRLPQSQRPRQRAPARPHLFAPELRKVLFDLSVVERTARKEIDRLFKERGFTKHRQANMMRRIRKEFG